MAIVGQDPPNTLDAARALVLEALEAHVSDRGNFDMDVVIEDAIQRQRASGKEVLHHDILTAAYDLFRTGTVSWGMDGPNKRYPKAHLTRRGRAALRGRGRDPSNPSGYLGHVRPLVRGMIAEGYIEEAVATYQAGCARATAVMVGAASEALVLGLRDELVSALSALGVKPPKGMSDWKAKTVLGAIEKTVQQQLLGSMPHPLRERFDGYWSAFANQIRFARNEAGHPSSVAPVDMDTAHANLLIFPSLAELAAEVRRWARSAGTP